MKGLFVLFATFASANAFHQRTEPDKAIAAYRITLRKEINAVATEAMKCMKDKTTYPEAEIAIRRLAILRQQDSVDFLLKNIEFCPREKNQISPIPTMEVTYPCVYALAEIGQPAFPNVMKLTEKELSEAMIYNIAYIIQHSTGKAIALAYLKLHYDDKPSDIKKANLEKIIAQVNKGLTP